MPIASSVKAYDIALEKKIGSIFKNKDGTKSRLWFTPYEKLIELAYDQSPGNTPPSFPLASLWRTKWNKGFSNNHAALFRGAHRNRETPTAPPNQLKRMAIDLTYQLDIISTTDDQVLAVAAELLWFLNDFPKLPIKMVRPYQFELNEASIEVLDTNDIFEVTEFRNIGSIYRVTFDLQINDAFIHNTLLTGPLVEEVEIAFEPV